LKRRWLFLLVPVCLALFVAVVFFNATPRPGAGPHSISVAVFRLDNNTGSPGYDRLAEVLTDSLIAELTQSGMRAGVPAYSVIGNDRELRLPRAQRDLLAIGSRLQTPVTISGSIRQATATSTAAPGQLEVFVQVITLPDQRHRKVVRLPIDAQTGTTSDLPRQIVNAVEPVIRALHNSP
jgi:TolB-like protein